MKNCQIKIAQPHRQPGSSSGQSSSLGQEVCSRTGRKTRSRTAVTSIDIIVSTVMLGVVLSTATSLCFRINQIWKGIAHQRLATQELSNQLDDLTRLNVGDARSAIQSLHASELCARSLHDPKLTGQISEDELGQRVTLQLRWNAYPKPMQAELAGWLIDPQPKPANGTADPPKTTGTASPPESTESDQIPRQTTRQTTRQIPRQTPGQTSGGL